MTSPSLSRFTPSLFHFFRAMWDGRTRVSSCDICGGTVFARAGHGVVTCDVCRFEFRLFPFVPPPSRFSPCPSWAREVASFLDKTTERPKWVEIRSGKKDRAGSMARTAVITIDGAESPHVVALRESGVDVAPADGPAGIIAMDQDPQPVARLRGAASQMTAGVPLFLAVTETPLGGESRRVQSDTRIGYANEARNNFFGANAFSMAVDKSGLKIVASHGFERDGELFALFFLELRQPHP